MCSWTSCSRRRVEALAGQAIAVLGGGCQSRGRSHPASGRGNVLPGRRCCRPWWANECVWRIGVVVEVVDVKSWITECLKSRRPVEPSSVRCGASRHYLARTLLPGAYLSRF